MAKYTYKQIVSKAKTCTKNINKSYKNGIDTEWSYYFAKGIISPNKDVTKISIKKAKNQQGESISRGISKADYTDMAKRYVKYVETHKQMPNYLEYKGIKIAPHLLTGFFGKVITNNFPKTQNINRKWYDKPSETGSVVFDYWVKKFKFAPKTMDDALSYVAKHFNYEHYYDDKKSNKEVIDSKAGNCTDLLQMIVNILQKLGYDVVVIHVKCRGGDGHVRYKARHKKYTENTWVYRDIACVASRGEIKCNWCMDGTVLATDPQWFMYNLHR